MVFTRSARVVFAFARETRSYPPAVRWVLTAALVLMGFGFRYALFGSVLALPYLMFIPGIIAASVLFGRGAGLLATGLSTAMVLTVIVPEDIPLALAPSLDLLGISIFAGISGLMSVLIEALHVAFLDAEKAYRARDLAVTELGHRTKNDLARIIAMISVQANGAEPAVATALNIAADRISTVARIYERFRVIDTHVAIDARDCLTDLVNDLSGTLSDHYQVSLTVDAESHILSASDAGALGLIANEIITNCLKHAFPQGRQGSVRVCFQRYSDTFVLTVFDDGVGMPEEGKRSSGIGTRIIRALARQLGGSVSCERLAVGTVSTVRFPAHELNAEIEPAASLPKAMKRTI